MNIENVCVIVNDLHELDYFVIKNTLPIKHAIVINQKTVQHNIYYGIVIMDLKCRSIDSSIKAFFYTANVQRMNRRKLNLFLERVRKDYIIVNAHDKGDLVHSFHFVESENYSVSVPVFCVTESVGGLDVEKHVYNITNVMQNKYKEKVCVISNSQFAKLYGFIPFPIDQIEKTKSIDGRHKYLRGFISHLVEVTRCSIIIITLSGLFLNPDYTNEKEENEALLKCIELATGIEYSIHVLPQNYIDINAIYYLKNWMDSRLAHAIDYFLISNVYLDMSIQNLNSTQVEKIYISELSDVLKNNYNKSAITVSVLEKKFEQVVITNIIKKLRNRCKIKIL